MSLKALLMSQEVWPENSGTGYEYTVSITVSSSMNILITGERTQDHFMHNLVVHKTLKRSCQIAKDVPSYPLPHLFGDFCFKNQINVCVF